MMDKGRLIYQERKPFTERMKIIIVQIFMLIVAVGTGGFLIISPFAYNYSNNSIHLYIFELMLGSAFLLTIYVFYTTLTEFPFNIYQNGFTYKCRLMGANKRDNFIQFDDIASFKFKNYGLSCIITTKKGFVFEIKVQPDWNSYIVLIKVIIDNFNVIKHPDINAIIAYIKSDKDEVIQYVEGQIVNTQRRAFEQLVDKNSDFI